MISDKSQDELSLLIFADILFREGVKFDVVARWVADHTNTTINFKQLGMKARTYFQRKRGDASTLHGNSRVLAVAIAWYTSSDGVAAKLIRGDDSLILKEQNFAPLVSNLDGFTSLFNFEAKLLEHDGSNFCAGNFIVLVQQGHITG